MILTILNHFRLTGRLLKDKRVNTWLKLALIALPVVYSAIPLAVDIPDFVPVVGLLDDLALIGMSTLIFKVVSPQAVVQEHMQALQGGGGGMQAVNLEAYRHPEELRNLGIGLMVSVGALLAAGIAAGAGWLLLFALGYLYTSLGRARYLANAIECTPSQMPEIHRALRAAQAGMPPVRVSLFVTQNPVMNAYTFGYRQPYTIMLTSALVEKLTPAEIRAVIGHELGHIHFNHVVLISLMGMSVTGLERLIFYLWSRSCEYTADAVALHASGNDPKLMISALLKMASGLQNISIDLDAFLAQLRDAGESQVADKAEVLSTHPFIHKRIRRLLEVAEGSRIVVVERQPQMGL